MTTYGQWEMGSSEFLMSPKGYAFDPMKFIQELLSLIQNCWRTTKAIAPLLLFILGYASLLVGLVASEIRLWSPGWSIHLVKWGGSTLLLILFALFWVAFGPPHQRPHDNYGNFQGDTMKRKQSKLVWKVGLRNVADDIFMWGVLIHGWIIGLLFVIVGAVLLYFKITGWGLIILIPGLIVLVLSIYFNRYDPPTFVE